MSGDWQLHPALLKTLILLLKRLRFDSATEKTTFDFLKIIIFMKFKNISNLHELTYKSPATRTFLIWGKSEQDFYVAKERNLFFIFLFFIFWYLIVFFLSFFIFLFLNFFYCFWFFDFLIFLGGRDFRVTLRPPP